MISESFIKFRQAVGKLCTIPFRESAHSPTSTLLLLNAAAFSAILNAAAFSAISDSDLGGRRAEMVSWPKIHFPCQLQHKPPYGLLAVWFTICWYGMYGIGFVEKLCSRWSRKGQLFMIESRKRTLRTMPSNQFCC